MLGVGIYFTEKELNAAHRSKASQWHSDKLQDMASELREYADRKLADINVAYERLQKRGTQDGEGKTLEAELHYLVQMTEEIEPAMRQITAALLAYDSSALPQAEMLLGSLDQLVCRTHQFLLRVQQEEPHWDATILQHGITKLINIILKLKKLIVLKCGERLDIWR